MGNLILILTSVSIYIDAEKWKSVGKILKKSINFYKKDHKPLIINLIKFQELLHEKSF